eukprot:8773930-Prorocentrum_lima.AAC.1
MLHLQQRLSEWTMELQCGSAGSSRSRSRIWSSNMVVSVSSSSSSSCSSRRSSSRRRSSSSSSSRSRRRTR